MTLLVDQLELGPIGTNCYVVRASSDASEAVVIDPGGDVDELRTALASNGVGCAGILITHGHWDHLGGVADLAEETGAQVYMAEDERFLLERLREFTPPGVPSRTYTPDVLLQGDETIELAGISFQTLRVPGHSPAHLAYYAEDCLFSGDVLFAGSIGRSDLPGGSPTDMNNSLRDVILPLDDEVIVCPGHGPQTTIGRERLTNPFLRDLA